MLSHIMGGTLPRGLVAYEKIPVESHGSSESLKDDIRRMAAEYAARGWSLVTLICEGPFIHLQFQAAPKHENSRSNLDIISGQTVRRKLR